MTRPSDEADDPPPHHIHAAHRPCRSLPLSPVALSTRALIHPRLPYFFRSGEPDDPTLDYPDVPTQYQVLQSTFALQFVQFSVSIGIRFLGFLIEIWGLLNRD